MAVLRGVGGLPSRTTAALRLQLSALMGDPEEGAAVREGALLGLARFLAAAPAARHPDLSLDLAGNVVASWRPRPRAKLSVTFEGSGRASWIACDLPGGTRFSGVLAPFGPEGLGPGLASWTGAEPQAASGPAPGGARP